MQFVQIGFKKYRPVVANQFLNIAISFNDIKQFGYFL